MPQPTHSNPVNSPALSKVLAYHERTKHAPGRYARSLGYMDWATQPCPFRRYDGAPLTQLEEVRPTTGPDLAGVFTGQVEDVRSVNRTSVSQLFYDSLALSAWKYVEATGARWALRVNPSSGNLHPTEGYLLAGPIGQINNQPALYHYAPYEHGLELRANLSPDDWQQLTGSLPSSVLLVGLTSIYCRESWKYGERAFRYCQHDVGHAIGAVLIAAAALGWQAALLETVCDRDLGILLGVHDQQGPEAEHPDCLIALWPHTENSSERAHQCCRAYQVSSNLTDRIGQLTFRGHPNQLGKEHHPWPVIDEVSTAAEQSEPPASSCWKHVAGLRSTSRGKNSLFQDVSLRMMIRQRRSAVAMNGQVRLDRTVFYHMLEMVEPTLHCVPFYALPWSPSVHLAIFVHRVDGLDPGLYVLCRDGDIKELKAAFGKPFVWQRPPKCPPGLQLKLLQSGDWRSAAALISCHQEIASEGVFSLGMIAKFEPSLRRYGAWFYKRLFWETGIIGQVLYLAAEAVGQSVSTCRSTGIGCFFDDQMHQALGLKGNCYQSLYHFTVGGAIDDERLRTSPAYAHRSDGS